MKRSKLILNLAIAGLGLGILVGCGDSGGGGGDATADVTPTAQLSPQNVDKFVQSVSDEVGCTYTETSNAPTLRGSSSAMLPIKTILSDISVMLNDKGINSNNLRVNLRETQTTQGECGGTMVVSTSADGKSGSYTFNNFCSIASNNTKSFINGALNLATTQSGEALTLTFATTSPLNLKSTNPTTNEKVDVTLSLTNGRFYSSNGSVTLNLDSPSGTSTLSIASVSVRDNVTNKSYSFQDVNVRMDGSSTTFSVSYTDPDLGKVTLSSKNGDVGAKSGDIVITGASGETAVISTSSTEGVFNVTSGGNTLGVMDCSVPLANSDL